VEIRASEIMEEAAQILRYSGRWDSATLFEHLRRLSQAKSLRRDLGKLDWFTFSGTRNTITSILLSLLEGAIGTVGAGGTIPQ